MCCLLRAVDENGAMVERLLAGESEASRQTDLCRCHFTCHTTDMMSHGAEIKALGEKPAPKCLS
jgi:hypothetical protein